MRACDDKLSLRDRSELMRGHRVELIYENIKTRGARFIALVKLLLHFRCRGCSPQGVLDTEVNGF